MNLLFVEDYKANQEALSIVFECWGIDFDVASNGKEAVNLAMENEGKYDICFMDTKMPIMDGFEATRFMRKNIKYFPILATSGNTHYKEDLLMNGADDFITKPWEIGELHKKIKAWSEVRIIRYIVNEKSKIKKEMPLDAKQAAILKELKDNGLAAINIFGTSTEATFIVNHLVPEFIEREFAEEQKQAVKFLDHNPESKGLCRLFAKTSLVIKTLMLDQDFDEENQIEMSKLNTILIKNDD